MTKYIIYVIIAVVIAGGIVAVGWFYPELFPFLENKNVSTANTNTVANANTTSNQNKNVNKALPINVNVSLKEGEITVGKEATYKDVKFNVLTADKTAEFEGQKAGSGKEFVILYLEKITGTSFTDIFSWLMSDIKLRNSGGESIALKGFNFAGESSTEYAASYINFEVEKADSGFTLNFGSGDSLKTIDLGF